MSDDHARRVEQAFSLQASAFEDPRFNRVFTSDAEWIFAELPLSAQDLVLDVAAGTGHAARLLAHNPAALFRLAHVKGALAIGRDADIALVRRDPYRYDAGASGNNFVSWSPYQGLELPYRVVETWLRGECVAAEGRVLAEPGNGRVVRPRAAA